MDAPGRKERGKEKRETESLGTAVPKRSRTQVQAGLRNRRQGRVCEGYLSMSVHLRIR